MIFVQCPILFCIILWQECFDVFGNGDSLLTRLLWSVRIFNNADLEIRNGFFGLSICFLSIYSKFNTFLPPLVGREQYRRQVKG